jgi:Holliday junction resolvase RusA-like endonuclease
MKPIASKWKQIKPRRSEWRGMSKLDTSDWELIVRSEIPGLPPSVNHYLCRRGKGTFKTQEARNWQVAATTILKLEHRHKPAYTGDVYVEIQCYTKRLKSLDIDNRIKLMQDSAAFAGIIENDSQVKRVTAEKLWTEGREYTVIEVRKVPENMYAIPIPEPKRKKKETQTQDNQK